MRSKIIFSVFFLCMISTSSIAATSVTPAAVVPPATTAAGSLVAQLVGNAPPGNITVVPGSETLTSVATAAVSQSGFVNNIAFGTVNLVPLNMPAPGIMLTTGSILGGSHALGTPGDVDVQAAIAAGAGATSDAATLQFSFTVPAGMTHISLDMIFATQETLGVIPAVRDAAVVILDGVNVAKFAKPDPVTTVMTNANTTSIFAALPLGTIISGFDKVSSRQTILAPLLVPLTTHTLKISIADHVDGLRDSAIILSNMVALTPTPGAVAAGTGVTISQGTGVGVIPVPGSPDPVAPRVRLVGNSIVHVLQGGLYIDPGAIAVDNIDGNITGAITTSFSPTPLDTTVARSYTETYSVQDFATPRNTGTATRTIIIDPAPALATTDVTPPVVTPPADLLLTATDFEGVASNDPRLSAFLAGATATDNVAVVGQVSYDLLTLPAKLPIGKTKITFKAHDAAGNTGTAQATVTVVGSNQVKAGADLDFDSIPDSWEMAIFGNLTTANGPLVTPVPLPVVPPAVPFAVGPPTDFDGDGLTDFTEWQLGSNPKLAKSNPSSVSTDSWGVVFSNNPSDSDGDGVVDVLEDAVTVNDGSRVSGLHVSVNGGVTYSVQATGGQLLDQFHVGLPGAGAPANILKSFGVLSFRVKSGGVNVPIRIISSVPFGSGAQFYKVDKAGAYSLIPLSKITVVSPTIVVISVTDGGPLDLDGVANGVIVDPIAVGGAPQVLGGSGSGGGGCSIASPGNAVDPLLPVLVLAAAFYMVRRRKAAVRA